MDRVFVTSLSVFFFPAVLRHRL